MLFMLALMPMCAMAQLSETDEALYWTDGSNCFTLEKRAGKPNFLNGFGGTLHEGGLVFGLQGKGNTYKIVNGDNGLDRNEEGFYEGQTMFEGKTGLTAKIKIIRGNRYMLIYEGNELINLFQEDNRYSDYSGIKGQEGLETMLITKFLLAGEYVDSKGDYVSFSAKERTVSGLFGQKREYTVPTVYDMPSMMIKFDDNTVYSFEHEDDGILLTKMDCTSEYAEDWSPTEETIRLYHVLPKDFKNTTGKTSRFDISCHEVLYPSVLGGFTKQELKLMRNQIYARWGYHFNSPELNEYFSQWKWYKDMGDNNAAVAEMTDVDKINVELIKRAEKTFDE